MAVDEGRVADKDRNLYSYKTKDGKTLWRIRYELPPDPVTGQRRQRNRRGFTSKTEARKALREALSRVDEGTHHDPTDVTVREWSERFLESIAPVGNGGRGHRGKVGLGTHQAYRSALRAYVVPAWGSRRMDSITGRDVDALYDRLETAGGRSGQGLAPKTIVNIHGLLSRFFKAAVRAKVIASSPLGEVDAPTADRAELDWWSTAELGAFVSHVQSDRLYAMWLLFATTGMRRGEVAGLTWDDVDLDPGRLRVEWTLGIVDSKATWKRWPKTKKGERTMALDPSTVAASKAWKIRQAEERLAIGPGWHDGHTDHLSQSRAGLVFTWPDGRAIHPERISDWFRRHTSDAELRSIRLHDVRHSYASAALAAATGWHTVKVISQRLGHASVGITVDTYSHVLPEMDREVADTLADVILGA